MPNKLRCAGCKAYLPREEMTIYGLSSICSPECLKRVRLRSRERPPKKAIVENNGHTNASRRRSTGVPAAIRKAIRKRDGRCRWCGVDNLLQVHHILYRSQGGPDEPSNLITLCLDHHAEAHSNKKKWQPVLLALIWMHYVDGQRMTVPEVYKLVEVGSEFLHSSPANIAVA
jgi:hypothetical protein